MKQKYLLVFVLALLLSATPALAITNYGLNAGGGIKANLGTSTNLRADLKAGLNEDRQNAKSEFKAEAQAQREEFQNKMQGLKEEFHANRGQARIIMVTRLFNATIDRFEKIVDRINSRIDKVEDEGGTTTEAEAFVALANTALDKAEADLAIFAAINVTVGTTTGTTTPQQKFEGAKAAAAAVREDLKEVRENLLKAIKSIMSVEKDLDINIQASSSASTEN